MIINLAIGGTWGGQQGIDNSAFPAQFKIDYVKVYEASQLSSHDRILPTRYQFYQNFPNPFNPTTSINFNVPIASEVILTIYNITGQEVAKIHNGYAQAGSYKAVWNGMDNLGNKAPSGVYFYELKAENHFHKVKKMTLLK